MSINGYAIAGYVSRLLACEHYMVATALRFHGSSWQLTAEKEEE